MMNIGISFAYPVPELCVFFKFYQGLITQWLSEEPYFPVCTMTSQVTCTCIYITVNNRFTVKNITLLLLQAVVIVSGAKASPSVQLSLPAATVVITHCLFSESRLSEQAGYKP